MLPQRSFDLHPILNSYCCITLAVSIMFKNNYIENELIGQSWRRDTKCDCKTDWLIVGSNPPRGDKIFTSIYISISSLWCRGKARRCVLPLNTQRLQFSRKWGTECLNTGFPLPTLLYAGYSVKLIIIFTHFISPKSYYLVSHRHCGNAGEVVASCQTDKFNVRKCSSSSIFKYGTLHLRPHTVNRWI